jgi:putative transposase
VGTGIPKGLKRYYGRGDLHFITFSCYRRLPLLGSAKARNLIVRVLGEVRERYRFTIIGYVVMPDHVHLLMGEPTVGTPSAVLKAVKQSVSRQLRRTRRRKQPPGQLQLTFAKNELPRFWQRRFYDFNVWSAKKVREKLEYRHRNPITRRLVDHPKDWPWSSWSFYQGQGPRLIEMDHVP